MLGYTITWYEDGYSSVDEEEAWIETELDLLHTTLATFVELAHDVIESRATDLLPFPGPSDDYEGEDVEPSVSIERDGKGFKLWHNDNIRVAMYHQPLGNVTYSWNAVINILITPDRLNSVGIPIADTESKAPWHKGLQIQFVFTIQAQQIRTDRLNVFIREAANIYHLRDEPDMLLSWIQLMWRDAVQIIHSNVPKQSGVTPASARNDSIPLLIDRATSEQWFAWFDWYYRQAWGAIADTAGHMAQLNGKSKSRNQDMHALYMAAKRI